MVALGDLQRITEWLSLEAPPCLPGPPCPIRTPPAAAQPHVQGGLGIPAPPRHCSKPPRTLKAGWVLGMCHGEARRSVVWALAPSQQQAVTGDISVQVPTRCRVTAGRARCPQEPAAPGEHGAEMPCRPQGVPAHTAELVSGSKPSLAFDLINITWPRRALSGTGSDTRTRGMLRVFPWSSPSGRDGFGKRQGAEGPNAASAFSSYSSESCSQWSARRVGETCPGTVRLAQPPCYRMDRSVIA